MPELPEVETTLRAILPVVNDRCVDNLVVRRGDLRWPVPALMPEKLAGQFIRNARRRAKYILADVADGTLIVHLGMSGSIRIVDVPPPAGPHDHIDLVMEGGPCLRFTDPRRFGAWLWAEGPPEDHVLLKHLGPEPWDAVLTAEALWQRAEGRKTPVKSFIMDNAVLVGVGNIYANEALFRAGIHPARAAGRISIQRWSLLLAEIRAVLAAAITSGGSTLRDFTSGDGKPGYFAQTLQVYGRSGLPCMTCGTVLQEVRIGGRSSVYCSRCQR
jgi:formamidopyrimidine-DNA glycosylase